MLPRSSLFILFLLSISKLLHASGKGELIVFVDAGQDSVTTDFRARILPRIDSLAKAQDMTLKVMEVQKGAPEAVQFSPAIFFQNHLGRSLYTGRYTYLDKLNTFIRTVRRLPRKEVENEKHDVLVWENERATLLTPVKITELSGSVPEGFDQETFRKKALKMIDKGMDRYDLKKLFMAKSAHRLIYTAFYPFRSEDGKLFLSMEMYSQFNCIEPIFRQFDKPLSGSWKDWEGVFRNAGEVIQTELIRQLSNTEKGDALVPVGSDVPVMTWEAIGLPLPAPPEGTEPGTIPTDIVLGDSWTMDGPVSADLPVLNFHFMAPVDYYAGEVSKLKGSLKLGTGANLREAAATFSIETESLTMGDESLDHSAQGAIMVADYPEAAFIFEKVSIFSNPRLAFGSLSQFAVQGTLDFIGIKAPLNVTAQIEPVLNEAGEARLQVYASFQLRLKERYNIDGPDGPMPQADTMVFYLNFLLKPTA